MLRQDKEQIVKELADRLKSSQNLLVADYRGLTMPEIDELRTKLLESGARFSVVKNTLTRRAAEEAGVKELLDLIDGPTAIAFIDAEGDPAAVAKILNDTARAHDVLVIRGGLLDGDTVTDVEVKRLATLPPADVVRAQLVGAVAGPLTTVVGLFTAPLRDLVNVIDARIKQLEEQGETAGAAEPSDLDHKGTETVAETQPEAEAEAQPEAEAEAEPEPEAEEPQSEEPQADAEAEAPAEEPAQESNEAEQEE
jgi:large subunit ribosomal protein L10